MSSKIIVAIALWFGPLLMPQPAYKPPTLLCQQFPRMICQQYA